VIVKGSDLVPLNAVTIQVCETPPLVVVTLFECAERLIRFVRDLGLHLWVVDPLQPACSRGARWYAQIIWYNFKRRKSHVIRICRRVSVGQ
jgi:hypothetical protein